MKKKFLCLLLSTVMVAATFTGCGTTGSTEKEIVESEVEESEVEESEAEESSLSGSITFAYHRTDLEPQMCEMIEEFENQNPNVTIELEIIADYETVMAVRAAGNELPDVFELQASIIPAEKWSEFCMPLNESRLYDKVVGQEAYTVDGNLYAFNSAVTYFCFMYNKELYAQAGITEVPTTWEEFTEAMNKLKTIEGVIPITSQYKTTWAMAYWVQRLADAYRGGNMLNEWAETDTPFSDETLIAVLDQAKALADNNLMDPDLMSSDWDLQAADFAAGTIGTYLTGSFANATMTGLGMDAENIGFFAYPAFEEGDSPVYSVGVDYGYAVNKDTENAELSLAFAEFITENSPKYLGYVTPIIGEECAIPAVNELLSQNAVAVTATRNGKEYNDIKAIAAISNGTLVQEYMVADDTEAVIKEYNDIWTNARTECLKQK